MSMTFLSNANDAHASGAGDQWVFGSGGHDTLASLSGNDTFDGASGNDSLVGGVGDLLYGGSGHDTLSGGTMEGGTGNDVYLLDAQLLSKSAVVKEAVGGGIDTVKVDIKTIGWFELDYTLGANVENFEIIDGLGEGGQRTHITGNALNNDIQGGTNQANHLLGMDGNDKITTGGGIQADTLDGGNGHDTLSASGNDLLFGGAGQDRLESHGADTMRGGAGDDVYVVREGGAWVLESFGEGNDTVLTNNTYHKLGTEVENLLYNENAPAKAFTFEGNSKSNVIKSSIFDDKLTGWGGADTMESGAGNDTVDAGDSDDAVLAGDGADIVIGGKGDDDVKGEAGNDSISGDAGYDILSGGDGEDWLSGGEGFDLILGGAGTDRLYGGLGNDSLEGGTEADTLAGDAGADTLDGGLGADRLLGGADADLLMGRDGDDRINGGAGRDSLIGDAGADRFVFGSIADSAKGAADLILDYQDGMDRIDLSVIDADGAFGTLNAFRFQAERPVFTSAGDLWVAQEGNSTWVRGDTNGDGAANLEIQIAGLHQLTASDFIL
jgi:Ca2+-binding RTX toxin-like protein